MKLLKIGNETYNLAQLVRFVEHSADESGSGSDARGEWIEVHFPAGQPPLHLKGNSVELFRRLIRPYPLNQLKQPGM